MMNPGKDLHVTVLISIDTGNKEFSDLQKMHAVAAALSELLNTVRESITSEEKIQAAENN